MNKMTRKPTNTTILLCTCTSSYQDEKYGRGRRVFNIRKDPNKVRCTVCGKDKLL